MTICRSLQIASGIIGVAAAVAWFLSVRIRAATEPGAHFETVDSAGMNPVRRRAGRLNQWAAGLTGVAVLLGSAGAVAR
jgi:hypothetical protein